MGVGFIENIWHNSEKTWYIKSVDTANNGKIGGKIELDGGKWHEIPKHKSECDYLGIPWFHEDGHYKALSCDPKKEKGVRLHQKSDGSKNYIVYSNLKSPYQEVARQEVPNTGYQADLRILAENTEQAFEIEVTNNQYSNIEFMTYVLEGFTWTIKTIGPIILELL